MDHWFLPEMKYSDLPFAELDRLPVRVGVYLNLSTVEADWNPSLCYARLRSRIFRRSCA